MASDSDKLSFIQRHCPKVTFHPSEEYFPCSIEHLLQGSTLKRRLPNTQGDLETVKCNPSPDQLGQHANGQHEYYLEIAPAQKGGFRPVDKRVEAPMYAAMVEVQGMFVDIYYIFLYAFQGSATFRCCYGVKKWCNAIAHDFGRHHGDVEHCVVRTDLSFSRVLSVGYEAHDKLAWFFPGDFTCNL